MAFFNIDKYGMVVKDSENIDKMFAPYRCMRCNKVHDAGNVEVVARYADCTMWKCPNCNATIDDRPIEWGGSAEPIRRHYG